MHRLQYMDSALLLEDAASLSLLVILYEERKRLYSHPVHRTAQLGYSIPVPWPCGVLFPVQALNINRATALWRLGWMSQPGIIPSSNSLGGMQQHLAERVLSNAGAVKA